MKAVNERVTKELEETKDKGITDAIFLTIIRREVNDTSKQKKSGKVDRLTSLVNLTAAILSLITALLPIIVMLSR